MSTYCVSGLAKSISIGLSYDRPAYDRWKSLSNIILYRFYHYKSISDNELQLPSK